MKPVQFSGTFIIRTNYNVGRTSLERTVNPDYLEGYDYKKAGLFENSHKFLILRNHTLEKDKKVMDWLKEQDITTWSIYNPVMVSEEKAFEMMKIYA